MFLLYSFKIYEEILGIISYIGVVFRKFTTGVFW